CPPTAPSIRARNSMADATPHTPNVTCTTNSTATPVLYRPVTCQSHLSTWTDAGAPFVFPAFVILHPPGCPLRGRSPADGRTGFGSGTSARRPAYKAPERRSALSGPPSKTAAARARGAGADRYFSSFPAAQSSG